MWIWNMCVCVRECVRVCVCVRGTGARCLHVCADGAPEPRSCSQRSGLRHERVHVSSRAYTKKCVGFLFLIIIKRYSGSLSFFKVRLQNTFHHGHWRDTWYEIRNYTGGVVITWPICHVIWTQTLYRNHLSKLSIFWSESNSRAAVSSFLIVFFI